jgi:hypothetical protein
MKRCGHCLRFLPDSDFHKRGDRSGGLASWCKCCTLHGRYPTHYEINPEPLTEALTNWKNHEHHALQSR